MQKYILSSRSLEELEKIVTDLGEPKFRAKQLHSWIYTKFASDFDAMTDISKNFRENLKNNALLTDIKIKQRQISEDKTIKYLLEYADGNVAECVLMRFDNRPNLTACVSSQIGCPVGCVFCATGKTGFVRNLSAREISEQIMIMQRDTGLRISNVVFMGQGEPLLNLDNVLGAIKIINEQIGIGIRKMTVSTSGILPGIQKLKEINFQANVALSLHAPNHEIREKIMPIEKKYNEKKTNIEKLTETIKKVFPNFTPNPQTYVINENKFVDNVDEKLMLNEAYRQYVSMVMRNPELKNSFDFVPTTELRTAIEGLYPFQLTGAQLVKFNSDYRNGKVEMIHNVFDMPKPIIEEPVQTDVEKDQIIIEDTPPALVETDDIEIEK